MNILFVYPDIINYASYKGTFHTGIASLSAFLKKNIPCNVSLLHLTKEIAKEDFLDRIESKNPDLVAFSSNSNMYYFAEKWARWIKNKNKDIKIICGGVHPTIVPEEVIQNPYIDVICIGEGEYPLLELCDKMNNGKNINEIEGLWIKNGFGKIYKNSAAAIIKNLDDLPFPDRYVFRYESLHYESEGRATVMISRGCPFSCAYCCNDILRKIYARNGNGCEYVRFRSVLNAIRELKLILSNYPFIKNIAFNDDILPLNKTWFREFTSQYRDEIGLPYDCNLHPGIVDEEIVDLLKGSGCYQVRMGIESGNDYIRNKILKRNISKEQLIKAFVLCNRNGLKIYSYNMIGLPFERLDMMLDTVKMNAMLPTDVNQVTIFYPYKKTLLYEVCKKEHLIEEGKEVQDYSRDTILKFNVIKRNQVIFVQRYFRILVKFYKNKTKFSYFINLLIEKGCFSSVISITILPILNGIMVIFWRNKVLSEFARRVNRKILK